MFNRRHVLYGLMALCVPLTSNAEEIDAAPAALADGWEVAKPTDAGFDTKALSELVEKIDSGWIPNVHALLIEHEGRLVFERYWPGEDISMTGELGLIEHSPTTRHDIRSITKSVTSLLLGIALGDAAENALASPIASFFPDRDDLDSELSALTLHHVLTMTAGLAWNETIASYSDERNDFKRYNSTSDPVGYVLSKGLQDPPGSRWNYNSGLTDVTAGVIEHLTGKPLTDFADEVLFGPLGITDYEWLRPRAWPPESFPSAGAGLRLRARDLAKIASLVLHDGVWQGRQLVPVDWLRISTTRHVEDIPWASGGAYGYGYYWYPGTLRDGRSPITGSNVIRAAGYGNQGVFILPEAGLTITVFAGNYADHGQSVDTRIMGLVARTLR